MRRGRSSRGRRQGHKRRWGEGNGFEEAGGYMNAKKNKLINQFKEDVERNHASGSSSSIFKGVAIFVNGYTDPPSDQLRMLMMEHGGYFHHYLMPGQTTHIIASNLPDTKVKNLKGNEVIVRPDWITESVKEGTLLDYRSYLLHTNATKNQPQLQLEKFSKTVTKDANDENFIEEFYGNSRLHHISSMANNFKRLVSEMRDAKINSVYPAREKLKSLGPRKCHEPTVMHIDMDCFFVSVGLRSHPKLVGKPVGVTHSKNGDGPSTSDNHSMAEIASCSYEARDAGVKNGMFVGDAKRLCPELQFIPYDFEAYIKVATKLYEIVANYTLNIQAVSCDEMLVDLKDIRADPVEFAEFLRKEVFESTGCRASVGLGKNVLLAKLATRNAKPNGVFRVKSNENDILDFMKTVPLAHLPGVGRKMVKRLEERWDVAVCGDVRSRLSLQNLQQEFGTKTGKNIYNGVRGITDVELSFCQERKSVSAEVNYGIRFKDESDVHNFLERLSNEVSLRCRNLNVIGGRSITLKLMIRAKGAPEETSKYMGHGICDNTSKTSTISVGTRDKNVILREVKSLLKKMDIVVSDIRGVGIQIGKLDKAQNSSSSGSTSVLMSFINRNTLLDESNTLTTKKNDVDPNSSSSSKAGASIPNSESSNNATLSMSQIDKDVFDSLPEDIRKEIESDMKSKARNEERKFTQKSAPKNNESLSSITYSQLDPEVLANLPQELLDEVKDSYCAGPSTRNASKNDAFKLLMSPSKAPKSPHKKSPTKRRGRKPLAASPKKHVIKKVIVTDKMKNKDDPIPSSAHKEEEEKIINFEFNSEPPPSDADLNGVKDLEGIRALIFEWITCSEFPTEDDSDTVSSFFLTKLSESDFYFVRSLLLQIQRLTSAKEDSSPWKVFYFQLLDKVQTHMLNKQGMKLFI